MQGLLKGLVRVHGVRLTGLLHPHGVTREGHAGGALALWRASLVSLRWLDHGGSRGILDHLGGDVCGLDQWIYQVGIRASTCSRAGSAPAGSGTDVGGDGGGLRMWAPVAAAAAAAADVLLVVGGIVATKWSAPAAVLKKPTEKRGVLLLGSEFVLHVIREDVNKLQQAKQQRQSLHMLLYRCDRQKGHVEAGHNHEVSLVL